MQIVSEPVAVIAYPVQDYDDGMVVAYAVGRGYYPEPTFDGKSPTTIYVAMPWGSWVHIHMCYHWFSS